MATRRSAYHVPERFLRQLWKHQHFSTSHLETSDHQPLEIISPGTLNRDGGPDFLDASIRIDGILLRGNIEIHEFEDGWNDHHHHTDPKYNGVILHVVFRKTENADPSTTKCKRSIPVLVLEPHMTSPFRSAWEKMIAGEREERGETIKCFPMNDGIDAALLKKWLSKLSVQRIELKVRRFEERLKEMVEVRRLVIKEPRGRYVEIPFGLNPEDLPPPVSSYSSKDFGNVTLWEQLLYEGVMEALGYSKNQEPFGKLARSVSVSIMQTYRTMLASDDPVLVTEAVLFGAGGLFPLTRDLFDRESREYVRQLRGLWKTCQATFRGERVHGSEWQFFRLRPENFPTVRIAGAARLMKFFSEGNIFKSIIQSTKASDMRSKDSFRFLQQLFVVSADGFWEHHFRFGERSAAEVKTLVGKHRANEIVLNVIIPICLLYARIFKDKEVRQGILKIFEQCPPLSENTITRTMESQLLKGKFTLDSAMLQQGAVQLYKCYCADERCGECAVGKMLF